MWDTKRRTKEPPRLRFYPGCFPCRVLSKPPPQIALYFNPIPAQGTRAWEIFWIPSACPPHPDVSSGRAHVSTSFSKSMRDYGPAESFAGLSCQNIIIWELRKRNGVIYSLGQKKKKKKKFLLFSTFPVVVDNL